MTNPVLHTEQLTRTVDGKPVINNVTFDVQPGDVIALVGASGAGKSSLLRLLNRLDEPTSGTVYLNGIDYRQIAPCELRRRVGMVLQTPFLFPGTVIDNLRFGPQQHGQDATKSQVESLLDRVGLAGFADRTVNNLSGGEAQRVSLARTLANQPEVLLLDEPTSALDDDIKLDVECLIRDIINDNSLTCLMITHDREQAARMANRILVMTAGRLTQDVPTMEVFDAQANDR